ncbi:lamin tail domain-containing protein [Candidatus Woesearchaeota archaeon]|nr:lamin tail domain-containing protein [Candidatus Woesearchaeota archaeon]
MNKLALALFIAAIVLTVASAVNGVQISEIMYDPVGDDYDFEFIELYTNETEDISNYRFEGIDFQFPGNTTITGYLVIANTLADFQQRYPDVSIEFEFKGALSNSGETIALLNEMNKIVDSVSYEPIADQGYSLELYNNTFIPSNQLHGTPGSAYVVTEDTELNETNEATSNHTNSCDLSLDIYLDKLIFQNNEKVQYKPLIYNDSFFAQGEEQDIDYVIEYFIEDAIGNIVRSSSNTTNTNTKTFTPDIDEMDKVFFITMTVFPECNDTNPENNKAIKSFYVINNISQLPKIEIKSINLGTDNKIKFGETLKATILVQRGNSSKKTVSLQVEDISETVKLNIDSKNENEFTIPMQLDSNCDDDFSDGLYDLVIEGFDLTVKTAVNVEGKVKSQCSSVKIEENPEKTEINKESENKTNKKAVIINSFYTRARNMFVGREILLFAKIENKNFTDNYDVILFEQTNGSNNTLSEQRISMKGGQILALNFSVNITKNTSAFGLKIGQNQAVLGTKKIPIFPVLQDDELSLNSLEFEGFSDSGQSEKTTLKNPKDLKTTATSQVALEQQKNKERAVVLDNGEGQRKRVINYLIMGLSVALNSILIWRR